MEQAEFEYLGPYRIEGIIGRGGMGTVYKGQHSKTGELAAIKLIAPGVANQMRFRRRFAAEAETMMRLKHPNIVGFIGSGEEHGLLFYVMEYIDGHSLHDYLRLHRTMPWPDVVQIGVEITAALKHAHDFGIIHRDLKPANLMQNKSGTVKLTDFGIAKLFGSTDMTAAGSVIGTADFMPPEQAEGKSITTRSDLYSLGAVMFAMMVGRSPFSGKTVPEVLYAVRYNPAPDSSLYVPDAPLELHALVSEMLEKDPLKRPPTALVIGNRLKAIQQGMLKLGTAIKPPGSAVAAPVLPAIDKPEIGKELTSIDLRDSDDEDLKLTGHAEGTRERPTIIAPEPLIPKGATAKPRSKPTSQPVENPGSPNSRPPAETIDSVVSGSQGPASLPSVEPSMVSPVSHYTPASEAQVKRFTIGTSAEESSGQIDWLHYGSIIGMAIVLLLSVGAIFWYWTPKSADDLYAEISVALDSGDDNQVLEVSQSIAEFIERFGDDPRSEELHEVLDESELVRSTRSLQLRRNLNAENLTAVEQAFLDVMKARTQGDDRGQAKIAAFLEVFGNQDKLSEREKRYVELVRFASNRLNLPTTIKTSRAELQLEMLVRSAESKLKGEKLQEYYDSLEQLYRDKPWAQTQLARIRRLKDNSGAIESK